MMSMYKQETFEEIKLLSQFNLASISTGIKVHTNEASEVSIKAAERLFDKGFISQADGGYLTQKVLKQLNMHKRL
jgi:conserved hypothetical protein TIGR02647